MKLLTKYITPDEFKIYFGIDLGAELKGDANPSDKANAFIMRIEDRMEAFLNDHFFKRVTDEWPCFTDWQKENYKKALLEQCIYVFRNGDISVDSGYDPDEGIKVSRNNLTELSIAPNAKMYLELCGLWSRHIKTGSFFGLWGM